MASAAPETVAAVDLGSNSFHMIVAQVVDGRLHVIDRMKEMVRLAAGLDSRNCLTGEVAERGIQCLGRFGERLSSFAPHRVRAVGTNTLRKARNRAEFLDRARVALGHRIDIISGAEEARLIYLGVSHSLEDNAERRLVVDIGGGSTELILGQRFQPHHLESLYMGCVSMSQAHFGDGVIDRDRMRAARLSGRLELAHIEADYRRLGWETAIGASGTILAIRDAVTGMGWSRDGITVASLHSLEEALIAAGHVSKLDTTGVQSERAPVFPGGVAILMAVFEGLGLSHMWAASGALREGLLYDLLGRVHAEDVRETTVAALAARYHVDAEQAARVRRTAGALFRMCARGWGLSQEEDGRMLAWAASLHEIGLSISHGQYHKHSGYLLTYLDMPGFARGEQQQLAALARGHRRKFPLEVFNALPPDAAAKIRHLCLILRLAVLLHRGRSDVELPAIEVEPLDYGLRLRFPEGWLDAFPLTRADLEQEAAYLKAAGLKLKFR
jgi:exopolyphosphatase/guanosine-5'-triphosphate,3'-diphosphate pyrophosphatase